MNETLAGPGPGEIRRYLLRHLPEAERAHFEEAYFSDDTLFDRIESEEDRLVSDYVLGHLSVSDKLRFEESLLATPYYKERVDTTSRLHRRLSRAPGMLPPRRAAMPGAEREGQPRKHTSILSDVPLFPLGTAKTVVIAILGVLFVASLLSAVALKRKVDLLEQGRQRTPLPTASIDYTDSSIRTFVVASPSQSGTGEIKFRSLATDPIRLVVARPLAEDLLARDQFPLTIVLTDSKGEPLWKASQPTLRDALPDGDLVFRLPVGLPPEGTSFLSFISGDLKRPLATFVAIDARPLAP